PSRTIATSAEITPDPKAYAPVGEDVPPVEARDLAVEGQVPPPPRIELEPDPATTAKAPAKPEPPNPAAVLDAFLKAKSLDERLPYMTPSNRSPQEVASSCLAVPLPPVVNIRSLHYMVDDAERHTEHFFEVAFLRVGEQRPAPFLVQLHDWGDGDIRVHSDAFIDLFEDKLSEFAKQPGDEARTFHVVADAYKHCFDEAIPGWDKRSFLKLRSHPRMAPKLHAYFNRNSPTAELISQPDALPWGESGICTVTVRWNRTVPKQPFVELVTINGFTWNP
ncbi:MAG: hypothetical protein HKO57_12490, partial [Akkermansiaceae bacterium]|nr:hypothetical protein [Akkermansiaceae bacterium]